MVITILSLYFICTDRIYILDFMEHHMPKKWVQKMGIHIKEITKNLRRILKGRIDTYNGIICDFCNRTICSEVCWNEC